MDTRSRKPLAHVPATVVAHREQDCAQGAYGIDFSGVDVIGMNTIPDVTGPSARSSAMSVAAFLQVSTWDREFVASLREHYSRSAGPPPGKKLAWRILVGGRHLGWIGIGEPTFALAARRRLGIPVHPPQPATVSCFIYRVEAQGIRRSSDVLKAWHPLAAREWEIRYGFAPIHWETLVDPSEVKSENAGACFRRAGYRSLGMTTGRGARRPAGASRGARVWGDTSRKLVLYRGPLARVAGSEQLVVAS